VTVSMVAAIVGGKWQWWHRGLDAGRVLSAGGSDTVAYRWGPRSLIKFHVFPK
jgi:hypothetical protein